MKTIFTAILLFLVVIVYGQDTKRDIAYKQDALQLDTTSITFENLLELNNMTFEAPKGYNEVKPFDNRQMNYEKAYKHPMERFEVRYSIRNHNHGITKQIFEMTVLNISCGLLPDYDPFVTEAVKSEFGADAGATFMVKVGEEFGQDYKYCLLVYIHKNGVGDGYIFYLADNTIIISDLISFFISRIQDFDPSKFEIKFALPKSLLQ